MLLGANEWNGRTPTARESLWCGSLFGGRWVPILPPAAGAAWELSATEHMGEAMSDHISWETCPHCHWRAAVGWLDGSAVEFDCSAGCRLAAPQLRVFTDERAAGSTSP
jgi:hypothetical protein